MNADQENLPRRHRDTEKSNNKIAVRGFPTTRFLDHLVSDPVFSSAASVPPCFKGVCFFQSVSSVWIRGKVFPFIGVEYF